VLPVVDACVVVVVGASVVVVGASVVVVVGASVVVVGASVVVVGASVVVVGASVVVVVVVVVPKHDSDDEHNVSAAHSRLVSSPHTTVCQLSHPIAALFAAVHNFVGSTQVADP